MSLEACSEDCIFHPLIRVVLPAGDTEAASCSPRTETAATAAQAEAPRPRDNALDNARMILVFGAVRGRENGRKRDPSKIRIHSHRNCNFFTDTLISFRKRWNVVKFVDIQRCITLHYSREMYAMWGFIFGCSLILTTSAAVEQG